MTYTDYASALLDPRWQRKRLEIFQRDDWKCQHCGESDKTLHVHHRYEYRAGALPWDYHDHELQTLCVDCHAMLKGLRPGSVQLLGDGGWQYDGKCPKCNSENIRDKGSYDKCLQCGLRISFSTFESTP